jgi:hypothetical protein
VPGEELIGCPGILDGVNFLKLGEYLSVLFPGWVQVYAEYGRWKVKKVVGLKAILGI